MNVQTPPRFIVSFYCVHCLHSKWMPTVSPPPPPPPSSPPSPLWHKRPPVQCPFPLPIFAWLAPPSFSNWLVGRMLSIVFFPTPIGLVLQKKNSSTSKFLKVSKNLVTDYCCLIMGVNSPDAAMHCSSCCALAIFFSCCIKCCSSCT